MEGIIETWSKGKNELRMRHGTVVLLKEQIESIAEKNTAEKISGSDP